jgi:hypothetical protein
VSGELTGYEAESVAEVGAVLDDNPADADEVYLRTMGHSVRAIAAVAAKRAGGGGGVTPGTVLPVADPAGVTVDTTTYDNPVTGSGKITTLVFPQQTAAFAIAIEGDAFPRWCWATDPVTDDLTLGDGTIDPDGGNGAYVGCNPQGDGTMALTLGGANAGLILNEIDANVGVRNKSTGAGGKFCLGNQATLSSGTGTPNFGGNVGDIYIRTDPGGANETIYRCTVAGSFGLATWVGIL